MKEPSTTARAAMNEETDTQPGHEDPPVGGNLQDWLRWAETKICLSLAASFYLKAPRELFAAGVLECYRDFLEMCEPHLRWYASEGGSYRKATAKVLRIPFTRLAQAMEHGQDWSWCTGAGEHHRHASPYQFQAMVGTPRHAPHPFRAAFPVEMFSADFGRFVDLVKRFASRVPFAFGNAGFSFNNSLEAYTEQCNEKHLLPVAMRFSGVEVEDRISTSLCCKDTIKGVNWLTLISMDFVERLGGKGALRAQLSEAIALHELPTGMMIQAGPAPGLGDVNAGERLPLYREVHRVLTPIRNLDHYMLGARIFGKDETRRWMSRFDD